MRKIFFTRRKEKQNRHSTVFFVVFALCGAACFGQTPTPTAPPPSNTINPPTTDNSSPVTREQAIQMTLAQVSVYNRTQLNERLAAEDIRQSRVSLYPRVTANPTVIYTSPSLAGNETGLPRAPSFLGANAISEYQGLVTATGEIDTSGKLRAIIRRNQALLEAARSGSEAMRRVLIENLDEAYLNLGLANIKRRAAEENLRIASEFENLTRILVSGGEVAPIDAVRAQVQTATRQDELSQARLAEQQAADALRVFIGYDFARPVSVSDLLTNVPDLTEIESLTADANQTRPEIAQLIAEGRAAREDVKIAKAERRPQLTYILDGGFISDSLRPRSILDSLGVRATVGVSIPLFDFGASRSRQTQAELKAQSAEQSKIFAERMLAQQFNAALLQAKSARDRIKLLGENIKNAEKVLDVSTLRYRSGEAPITEVTDAQTSLVAQRAALYQAIFDYQIAAARLRQAVGK